MMMGDFKFRSAPDQRGIYKCIDVTVSSCPKGNSPQDIRHRGSCLVIVQFVNQHYSIPHGTRSFERGLASVEPMN